MPCYKSTTMPGGTTTEGLASYTTEADCLQACREGACCEGTTCSVKPQCQCQGAGKVFKGVGTVCTPNPCACATACGGNPMPLTLTATISNYSGIGFVGLPLNGTYTLTREINPTTDFGCRFFQYTTTTVQACATLSGGFLASLALGVTASNGSGIDLGVRIRNVIDVSAQVDLEGGAQIFPGSCGEAIGLVLSTTSAGCARPISATGSSKVMLYSFGARSFSIPLGSTFNWSISENPLP